MLPLHALRRRRRRRRLAGAERGSRHLQIPLKRLCERVRAAEDASRDPFRVLACRHGFAEIVECGGVVLVERPRVNPSHLEGEFIIDDLREAVTTLEDSQRIARRVFGGAHPTTAGLGAELKLSRESLRAREAPPTSG